MSALDAIKVGTFKDGGNDCADALTYVWKVSDVLWCAWTEKGDWFSSRDDVYAIVTDGTVPRESWPDGLTECIQESVDHEKEVADES